MRANPFPQLAVSPAVHFKLMFYAAASWLIAAVAERDDDRHQPSRRFPFLDGYERELRRHAPSRLDATGTARWWEEAVCDWEESYDGFLPIRAIRTAAVLDRDAILLLFAVGLVEEDARFGQMFDSLEGAPIRRPTIGALTAIWDGRRDSGEVRALVNDLRRLALVHVANPDAPRAEWALQVPGVLWDAIHGDGRHETLGWAQYRPPSALVTLNSVIVQDELRVPLSEMPALLQSGESHALILRGPRHNGRHTVLGAVARALGRGVLEIPGLSRPDDERWRQAGLLAVAWNALPVLAFDAGQGETIEIPTFGAYGGPIGIVLGRNGGVSGPGVERAISFALEMPDPPSRREHWRRAVPSGAIDHLDRLADRFRLTAGNIRRAAALARSYASLSGRVAITAADVQQATRALNREALDALAERLPSSGDWSHLAAREETLRELLDLELRCRHRERLRVGTPDSATLTSNCGVRALFRGPSGTGKTLAARLLASVLQADLYRLDLASLVDKYIGETEKNLDRALSRAEELGVVLLLDEGDALLTQRTSVQTSNDRYANLETNFLLQRLESFEGILIVTTNAGDRIDSAFERRMDVVIDFRPPDATERWDIWQLHLPATHRVDPDFLTDVASRCVLSGGQIRNAVLHAAMVALDSGETLTAQHLEAAVRREYRKAGAVCPLRRSDALWAIKV
jgi:hypothetical protein